MLRQLLVRRDFPATSHPIKIALEDSLCKVKPVADRAALDWALERGSTCGGWCPEAPLLEGQPNGDLCPMQ
jgi:putative molybdenum carrier protein